MIVIEIELALQLAHAKPTILRDYLQYAGRWRSVCCHIDEQVVVLEDQLTITAKSRYIIMRTLSHLVYHTTLNDIMLRLIYT